MFRLSTHFVKVAIDTGQTVRQVVRGSIVAMLMLPLASGGVQAQITTPPPDGRTPPAPSPTATNAPRFACQVISGQHTVVYFPESRPGQAYPWAVPSAMGSAWSPERRCGEISRRLESYRPDGLVEMRTAIENGYNTICVTTEKVPTCRIVLTVPQGQDPIQTRDRVFQNLTIADSGQQTQGVNTFTGQNPAIGELNDWIRLGHPPTGSFPGGNPSINPNVRMGNRGLNLRPFLDPMDGGTGTGLVGVGVSGNGRRLNPGNFR